MRRLQQAVVVLSDRCSTCSRLASLPYASSYAHHRRFLETQGKPRPVRSPWRTPGASTDVAPGPLGGLTPLQHEELSRPDSPYYGQLLQRRSTPPRYTHIAGFCKTIIPVLPAATLDDPSPTFYSLTGYRRTTTGERASQYLRQRRNHIPAEIFHPDDPQHGHVNFSMERAPFDKLLRDWTEPGAMTRVGTVTIVRPDLWQLVETRAAVAPQSYTVFIRTIKRHPVSSEVLCVVFEQFVENRPFRLQVPVRYINESESIGVRKGGLLLHIKHAVRCVYSGRARDIPLGFVLDLLHLPMGTVVCNTDIVMPRGLRLFDPRKQLVLCVIQGLGKQVDWQEPDEAATPAVGATPAAKAIGPGGTKPGAGGAAAKAPAAGAAATPAASGGVAAGKPAAATAAKKDDAKKK